MYKIGLTGGIGSGKSRVADLLAEWGAAIIDTDVIAHELTAPGGAAIASIRQHFGPDLIAATGALDRQAMRDLVFESPEARHQLEALLHPMIGAVTKQRVDAARGCYLVFVVPLLVESGHWRDRVDRICVVGCDTETQFKRVQARSGLTREAIARIINAQVPRETRLAAADDVIINNGATTADELVRRARVLHDGWCVQARQGCSPS